jgi:hypothetical protein
VVPVLHMHALPGSALKVTICPRCGPGAVLRGDGLGSELAQGGGVQQRAHNRRRLERADKPGEQDPP